MTEIHAFQRLERAVNLIARHPFYPGKQDAVHDCLNYLEERFLQGTLTLEQKSRLIAILLPQDD